MSLKRNPHTKTRRKPRNKQDLSKAKQPGRRAPQRKKKCVCGHGKRSHVQDSQCQKCECTRYYTGVN